MFPKKIDIRPWDPEYSCFTPTCSIAFSKRTPDGDVHKLEKAFRIAGMTSLGIPIFCDLSNSGRVPPGLLSAIGKKEYEHLIVLQTMNEIKYVLLIGLIGSSSNSPSSSGIDWACTSSNACWAAALAAARFRSAALGRAALATAALSSPSFSRSRCSNALVFLSSNGGISLSKSSTASGLNASRIDEYSAARC